MCELFQLLNRGASWKQLNEVPTGVNILHTQGVLNFQTVLIKVRSIVQWPWRRWNLCVSCSEYVRPCVCVVFPVLMPWHFKQPVCPRLSMHDSKHVWSVCFFWHPICQEMITFSHRAALIWISTDRKFKKGSAHCWRETINFCPNYR